MIRLEAWRSIRQGLAQLALRALLLIALALLSFWWWWSLFLHQNNMEPAAQCLVVVLALGLFALTHCWPSWLPRGTHDDDDKNKINLDGRQLLRQHARGRSNMANKNLQESRQQQQEAEAPARLAAQQPNSTPTNHNNNNNNKVGSDDSSHVVLSLLPADVLVHVCAYLHPRDVTRLTCLARAARQHFGAPSIWKRLWYRDYGNVLLQWPVGRQVLADSLSSSSSQDDALLLGNHDTASLEERLAHHLDHFVVSMHDFYFIFGEVYLNYLLARRNNADSRANNGCYLGLHGHVLDFAPFANHHPGLDTDDILVHCGADATAYFEELPHSTVARAIARQLTVVIHRGCLLQSSSRSNDTAQQQQGEQSHEPQCGLSLRPLPADLPHLLRASNSRPLRQRQEEHEQQHEDVLERLLPARRRNATRRPPTLWRIRQAWDTQRQEQEAQILEQLTQQQRQEQPTIPFSLWLLSRGTAGSWSNPTDWRIYYDPLQQVWIPWNARASLK